MNLAHITPLILTWNEAPNLARCLEPLTAFPRVVVLDSHSTDGTAAIARAFPNVTFQQRAFDDHTSQWNHGVALADSPWILALDADYVLDPGFVSELASLAPVPSVVAYHARFRYCIAGRPLRATLYPPRAVLFRKEACTYRQDGHTQLLDINGTTGLIQSFINHDDRKSLTRWIQSQDRYALLEAEKLATALDASLSLQDRLRKSMVLAPFATLIYCLFAKGLLFDGWRGWFYTLQRVLAEVILALHLLDHRLQKKLPRT
ncbi:glycosyltransferase family 2 protein [Verrucomicrobium spinosum]|uniref:glycosyltransferase family 2 protein n=1 Tax=Verrucomicrobium spinosum TaxID=2736 RepID=UPI000174604D|nr:glycosyltransferase family 2 protein [Verrucomicrobium spinosum]